MRAAQSDTGSMQLCSTVQLTVMPAQSTQKESGKTTSVLQACGAACAQIVGRHKYLQCMAQVDKANTNQHRTWYLLPCGRRPASARRKVDLPQVGGPSSSVSRPGFSTPRAPSTSFSSRRSRLCRHSSVCAQRRAEVTV